MSSADSHCDTAGGWLAGRSVHFCHFAVVTVTLRDCCGDDRRNPPILLRTGLLLGRDCRDGLLAATLKVQPVLGLAARPPCGFTLLQTKAN